VAGRIHPYGFAGVEMGASLDALTIARPHARCAPQDRAGVTVCVADAQPLGGGFFAQDLTYRYVKGNLAQISFHTSVDGFAFVMAKLKLDFGQPVDERRDTVLIGRYAFPHVAYIWRNGRSSILVSDPVAPRQLVVRITLDAAAASLGPSTS
jgi:hypothetical protein